MAKHGLIVGSVNAVKAALARPEAFEVARLTPIGSAIIGAGDPHGPVITRAPIWQALDFANVKADAVILAEPPKDGAAARSILAKASAARMTVHLMQPEGIRPLTLDDLLGRPLGAVDWARIRTLIEGKRILITGGGGSIGSELARRIAAFAPARLTLLDSSEYNLYRIGLDLRDAKLALSDIRDAAAMHRWFASERPDLVFHTAALKQVPLVEAFPCEGVLTNVSGLRNVAEAARGVGANLVFVSTDKAVDPSGVMGATKRLGELYCQALDRSGAQRAICLRLGNVLGSTGSVSPIFENQLAAGGPLTVTDPDVTRFFLTIPQAADALLRAGAVGLAGEHRGTAMVIEMGEALPVVELAREVIRLAGCRPDEDVPIVFTGLRPGEKLHESLVASYEWRESDPAPGVIAAASAPRALSDIQQAMDRLALLARQGADDPVREALFAAVAERVREDKPLSAAG